MLYEPLFNTKEISNHYYYYYYYYFGHKEGLKMSCEDGKGCQREKA